MFILWIYSLFETRAFTFKDMKSLIEFIDDNITGHDTYFKIEKVGNKNE